MNVNFDSGTVRWPEKPKLISRTTHLHLHRESRCARKTSALTPGVTRTPLRQSTIAATIFQCPIRHIPSRSVLIYFHCRFTYNKKDRLCAIVFRICRLNSRGLNQPKNKSQHDDFSHKVENIRRRRTMHGCTINGRIWSESDRATVERVFRRWNLCKICLTFSHVLMKLIRVFLSCRI